MERAGVQYVETVLEGETYGHAVQSLGTRVGVVKRAVLDSHAIDAIGGGLGGVWRSEHGRIFDNEGRVAGLHVGLPNASERSFRCEDEVVIFAQVSHAVQGDRGWKTGDLFDDGWNGDCAIGESDEGAHVDREDGATSQLGIIICNHIKHVRRELCYAQGRGECREFVEHNRRQDRERVDLPEPSCGKRCSHKDLAIGAGVQILESEGACIEKFVNGQCW